MRECVCGEWRACFGHTAVQVPFGECGVVREWLRVRGSVGRPAAEHPKRRVLGLQCQRSEVSGSRFWGFFRELCDTPENFFSSCYVHNYCPLCFMAASGRNVTPPQMKKEVRGELEKMCDRSLVEVVKVLGVEWVVGVGKYPQERAEAALRACEEVRVGYLSHPSPANPAANRGWKDLAHKQLGELRLIEAIRRPGPC